VAKQSAKSAAINWRSESSAKLNGESGNNDGVA